MKMLGWKTRRLVKKGMLNLFLGLIENFKHRRNRVDNLLWNLITQATRTTILMWK